jgi:ABC-type transport system involved in multi-copper enzyme maturation permease subunit
VISRTGIRLVLARRWLLALLLVAWGPFFVRAVQIYVAATFQQASFLAATAQTFREFLGQQATFVFFVTLFVGSGLIADDRRANALQVYLSRPLTQGEYIIGKLVVLLVFLLGVTWLPAILLLSLQVAFSGPAFVQANLYLVPAITLFAVLQACASAVAMLALSSLSRNRRFVAVMYAGVIFFTDAVSDTVRALTGRATMAWISPGRSIDILGDAIFRLQNVHDVPVAVALASIVAILAAGACVLHSRVRAVDVVA